MSQEKGRPLFRHTVTRAAGLEPHAYRGNRGPFMNLKYADALPQFWTLDKIAHDFLFTFDAQENPLHIEKGELSLLLKLARVQLSSGSHYFNASRAKARQWGEIDSEPHRDITGLRSGWADSTQALIARTAFLIKAPVPRGKRFWPDNPGFVYDPSNPMGFQTSYDARELPDVPMVNLVSEVRYRNRWYSAKNPAIAQLIAPLFRFYELYFEGLRACGPNVGIEEAIHCLRRARDESQLTDALDADKRLEPRNKR